MATDPEKAELRELEASELLADGWARDPEFLSLLRADVAAVATEGFGELLTPTDLARRFAEREARRK